MRKQLLFAVICTLCCTALFAQPDATAKIRKEGLENSGVMDFAFRLTDVSGPRLTNSPGFFRAANWAKDELIKMGLSNATIEP